MLWVGGCDEPSSDEVDARDGIDVAEMDLGGLEPPADAELVYFFSRVVQDDDVVDAQEHGELTLDVWQRAARPWTYDEEIWRYSEATTETYAADGTMTQRYAIWREPNIPAAAATSDAPPLHVSQSFSDAIAADVTDAVEQSGGEYWDNGYFGERFIYGYPFPFIAAVIEKQHVDDEAGLPRSCASPRSVTT